MTGEAWDNWNLAALVMAAFTLGFSSSSMMWLWINGAAAEAKMIPIACKHSGHAWKAINCQGD